MFDNGKINKEGKTILRKKASGYVSYLRGENPINFPYKLEPQGDDILKPIDLPSKDMKNNTIPEDKRLKYLTFVNCPMKGLQLEVYKKYFDSGTFDVNAFDTVGSQICNIVFNNDMDKKEREIEDVTNFYSEKGMKTILKTKGKKYNLKDGLENYFDLIYVDGAHDSKNVIIDAILSYKLVKQDGIIIFDDYLWKTKDKNLLKSPKFAIDSFVNIFYDKLYIIRHTLNQLYVIKTVFYK